MRRVLFPAIAILVCAAPVMAEPGGPTVPASAAQSPEATVAEIAAARDEADRLIATAGAQAWFENVTDSASPTVLHVPSGLRCTFTGSPEDQIVIFDEGQVRGGNDVGCVTYDPDLDIDLTLYATRYAPLPSEQFILQSAIDAIRSRFPSAVPYQGDLASMEIDNRGAPLAAAFNIETNQGPKFTLVLVWHGDEWGYKARATGPQSDGLGVSVYASLMFTSGLLELED